MYQTILESLPSLRQELHTATVHSEFPSDSRTIGKAIAYLNLLEDLIKQQNQEETGEHK